MICPHCHQEHPDSARFCPVTGQEITNNQPICPNCYRETLPGLSYCTFCGAKLVSEQTVPVATPPAYVATGVVKHRSPIWLLGLIFVLALILVGGGIYLVFFAGGDQATPSPQVTNGEQSDLEVAAFEVEPITTLELGSGEDNQPSETEKPAEPPTNTPVPTDTSAPTNTIEPSDTPQPTSTPTPANQPVALEVNSIDGAEIVFIPAGEFLMGSDASIDPYFYGAEAPQHRVSLDEYWIYRTEVTNAMYQKCVEAQACPRPVANNSNTRSEYYDNPTYRDYPVVYVSWRHAAAYCVWAGGKLPTEAEWEKAGRGTDGRLFPWGNERPNDNLARFGSNDTAKVGSYPDGASPYGVFDMAGNVIEWVFDYFQSGYYSISPEENPLGPASGSTHVYRSGSFENPVDAIRVVMRGSRSEEHANVDIGFRCVLDR